MWCTVLHMNWNAIFTNKQSTGCVFAELLFDPAPVICAILSPVTTILNPTGIASWNPNMTSHYTFKLPGGTMKLVPDNLFRVSGTIIANRWKRVLPGSKLELQIYVGVNGVDPVKVRIIQYFFDLDFENDFDLDDSNSKITRHCHPYSTCCAAVWFPFRFVNHCI